MTTARWDSMAHRTSVRLAAMVLAGLGAALAIGGLASWPAAPIVGWATAALVYNVWVWLVIGPMKAADTASHSQREDPSRGTSDLLVVIAAVASLGAVALVLVQARGASAGVRATYAGLAVAGVALSWLLVHTLFTLRYARLYYADDHGDGRPGAIDFNQETLPQYTDFAYLAFGIGMTFQVADTDLRSHRIRALALRHTLLSYLFGSVILATTINLVVGLTS